MKSKIATLVVAGVALAMAVVSIILSVTGEITIVQLGTFLGIGLFVLAIDVLARCQTKK